MTHTWTIFLWASVVLWACRAQHSPEADPKILSAKEVGGPCEGCEWINTGIPEEIDAVDTSTAWSANIRQLMVQGKVLHPDGKTPAAHVILYYWHTNAKGIYPVQPTEKSTGHRHGTIRGWIRTDTSGNYTLHTIRPGSYPNRKEPQHIHWFVKEPSLSETYYIDAFVFDDDPLLTSQKRKELKNRGGSGILRPVLANGKEVAEKNIILGLNIPNYPNIPHP